MTGLLSQRLHAGKLAAEENVEDSALFLRHGSRKL
jgi:hypothetical protein